MIGFGIEHGYRSYYAAPSNRYREGREARLEEVLATLVDAASTVPAVSDRSRPAPVSRAAAEYAEEASWIEVARPLEPVIMGKLTEDVLMLTDVPAADLARRLDVPAAALADRVDDDELDDTSRRRLSAVRAAALAMYGGLGAQGVGVWLISGTPSPLQAIAKDQMDELQRRLDRYASSPAE